MGSKGWRPGSRGERVEPVGGGEDPAGVGRAVARGQPELDRLAGGIEADQVHPRRLARPDRDDLEVVGGRQARMVRDDPADEVQRGSGRPVALRASMPLDEVRIERLERPEQVDSGLDQPAEQDDTEAEVGGGDRGRAVIREKRFDAIPVGTPAGGRDHEGPAACRECRLQVVGDGVAAGGVDDETCAAQRRRIVPAVPRASEDANGPCRPPSSDLTPLQAGGLHRATECAVTEDEDVVHIEVPSMRWEGRRSGGAGHKKTAVTVVVPRPLEPPFPGGPGSSCRTRRLEPQGPCLPAGPPELLLGVVREGAAVHGCNSYA